MKKTLLILLSIILIISLCSCAQSVSSDNSKTDEIPTLSEKEEEKQIKKALKYLNEEYSYLEESPENTFEFEYIFADYSQGNDFAMCVNWAGLEPVYVYHYEQDGEEWYTDNFVAAYHMGNISNILHEMGEQMFGLKYSVYHIVDTYAYIDKDTFEGDFRSDENFKKLITMNEANIRIAYVIPYSSPDELTDSYKASLEKTLRLFFSYYNVCFDGTVYLVQEDKFELYEKHALDYILNEEYDYAFDFEMTDTTGFSSTKWTSCLETGQY